MESKSTNDFLQGEVCFGTPKSNFWFIAHSDYPKNLFCHRSDLAPDTAGLAKGDCVHFRPVLREHNQQNDQLNWVATDVTLISPIEPDETTCSMKNDSETPKANEPQTSPSVKVAPAQGTTDTERNPPMNAQRSCLQRILQRLVRAAKTGKSSVGISEIIRHAPIRSALLEDLIPWVPNEGETAILRKIQSKVGELKNPNNAAKFAENRDQLKTQLRELPGRYGEPLKQLAELEFKHPPKHPQKRKRNFSPEKKGKKAEPKARGASSPVSEKAAKKRLKQTPWMAHTAVSNWSQAATDLTIYIDETWPVEEKDMGVIAGIVWKGSSPDPKLLPIPQQHNKNLTTALRHIADLRECGDQAYPFVFKFKPPEQLSRAHAYEQMIHDSLLLLLGWLLPKPGGNHAVGVKVICEALQGHENNEDQTAHFQGILLQAGRRDPGRFKGWVLNQLSWRKKDLKNPKDFSESEIKEQGYLGFGDLLAYMALEKDNEKAARIAAEADLRSMPGYLSFSPDLIGQLESIFNQGILDPKQVLGVLRENLGTHFGKRIATGLQERLKKDFRSAQAILGEMDRLYQQKERNLRELDRLWIALESAFENSDEPLPRRLQLTQGAIRLQRANHFGDFQTLMPVEKNYQSLREVTLENGEADLIAHFDLNLAVRASDRFEPEQAMAIVDDLLEEEPRLSLLSRVKAYSSKGQYLSMTGGYAEAEAAFSHALGLLDRAELSAADQLAEWDQTMIYRAFNAIDAGYPQAIELTSSIFQKITKMDLAQAAREMAASQSIPEQYRHHLFLRLVDGFEACREFGEVYLRHLVAGREVPDNHPWQLIQMYRGLMVVESDDKESALEYFKNAIEIGMSEKHGDTLRAITAMIAAVAWVATEDDYFQNVGFQLIDGDGQAPNVETLERSLPSMVSQMHSLKSILKDPDPDPENVDSALCTFFFNYR